MTLPVLRSFHDVAINGVNCESVHRCGYDLDTKTLTMELTSPTLLTDLGIDNRPTIMVRINNVNYEDGRDFLVEVENDYQYMAVAAIKESKFEFDIVNFVGVKCTT